MDFSRLLASNGYRPLFRTSSTFGMATGYDIYGEARIIGDFVDIGADEFSGIQVDAGDTIYEKIPAGASSVDVDFESAEIKYIRGDDVPTQLSYQWSCD